MIMGNVLGNVSGSCLSSGVFSCRLMLLGKVLASPSILGYKLSYAQCRS